MAAADKARVFISYSKADTERVERIVEHLDRVGFDVVRESEIAAGAHWTEQIQDTISSCDAVVAVVSDRYVRSEWAQTETAFALGAEKRVLPIMIEECQPSGLIGSIQMLDATQDVDEGARIAGEVLGGWQS